MIVVRGDAIGVCLVLRPSFTCCISLLLFGFPSTRHERDREVSKGIGVVGATDWVCTI